VAFDALHVAAVPAFGVELGARTKDLVGERTRRGYSPLTFVGGSLALAAYGVA
jgi:hypothetical protein